jgi:putative SOS response-associated peptidase YedK
MCGRFALYSDPSILARRFDAAPPAGLSPRYNVAPIQSVSILREEQGRRHFSMVRWGLIPHWAKAMDTGFSTINARAETVAEKPTFRDAFRRRRCLIPADGFYEWQPRPRVKIKRPWFVALRERAPMAFAGLWESWNHPEGGTVESCTIIVTDANELMHGIHERMPAILGPWDWDAWLDPEARDARRLLDLLRPYPHAEMMAWPVSLAVNDPKHDAEDCLESAADLALG